MFQIEYVNGAIHGWETVADGVDKLVLRAKPGENRVLLRIAAGKAYPKHAHSVPDEVFVVEGIYADPSVEQGKEFGPGSYLITRQEQSITLQAPPVVPSLSGIQMYQTKQNKQDRKQLLNSL